MSQHGRRIVDRFRMPSGEEAVVVGSNSTGQRSMQGSDRTGRRQTRRLRVCRPPPRSNALNNRECGGKARRSSGLRDRPSFDATALESARPFSPATWASSRGTNRGSAPTRRNAGLAGPEAERACRTARSEPRRVESVVETRFQVRAAGVRHTIAICESGRVCENRDDRTAIDFLLLVYGISGPLALIRQGEKN